MKFGVLLFKNNVLEHFFLFKTFLLLDFTFKFKTCFPLVINFHYFWIGFLIMYLMYSLFLFGINRFIVLDYCKSFVLIDFNCFFINFVKNCLL